MTSCAAPPLGLCVGGRWIAGETARLTSPVISPSTGETVAELPMATEADIDDALSAAEAGFRTWRRTPAYDRSKILHGVAHRMRERRNELARSIAQELGKPLPEAAREAETAAEMFEWAAEEARRAYGRVIPARGSDQRLEAVWEPVGPVAAFSPWNAPAMTPSRKISGALAAGCSIVLKAAEETPGPAVIIARCAEEAGVPPGVLNLVFGDPVMISRRLLGSPVIRALSFTGSTAVGRALAAQAGGNLQRMTLELGGHAPVLVFDDVDVEAVAGAAVAAKFRNAGQICTSPTRFYVQESIYRRFAKCFAAAARRIAVGDPFTAGVAMGPVQSARRLQWMAQLTDDARARGVTIAAGGQGLRNSGFFWEPTVLVDAGDECLAANEEPFGPMAVLAPFKHLDEALARANRLPQALAGYAMTKNVRIAAAVREEMNVGALAINHWQVSWPETPFGGRGASGYGAEGGVDGIRAFQQIKFIGEAA